MTTPENNIEESLSIFTENTTEEEARGTWNELFGVDSSQALTIDSLLRTGATNGSEIRAHAINTADIQTGTIPAATIQTGNIRGARGRNLYDSYRQEPLWTVSRDESLDYLRWNDPPTRSYFRQTSSNWLRTATERMDLSEKMAFLNLLFLEKRYEKKVIEFISDDVVRTSRDFQWEDLPF